MDKGKAKFITFESFGSLAYVKSITGHLKTKDLLMICIGNERPINALIQIPSRFMLA